MKGGVLVKRMIAFFVVGFILMYMLSCGKTNLDPPAGTLSTTTTDNSGVFSDTSSHLAGNQTTNSGNSGTTSETTGDNPVVDKEYMLSIVDRIYKAAKDSVYRNYYLSENRDEMIKQGQISSKSASRYFGTSIDYEFAVYSETNVSAVAFSMCLLKAKEGANIQKIITAVKDNANPKKWECATAESVVVESNGNYVILIMGDASETASLKEAFLSLNIK